MPHAYPSFGILVRSGRPSEALRVYPSLPRSKCRCSAPTEACLVSYQVAVFFCPCYVSHGAAQPLEIVGLEVIGYAETLLIVGVRYFGSTSVWTALHMQAGLTKRTRAFDRWGEIQD